MATFEIYDDAGAGFNMPASAADGYIIGSSGGVSGALLYDDGSLAIFAVFGNPVIDELSVTYSIYGDTLLIDDIEYYSGDWTVLQMLDLNLVGSISDLESADFFYAELNTGNDYFGGNNYVDVIHGGPGDDTVDGYASGDVLFGDSGNDYLSGGAGKDTIFGGVGDDLIEGLSGKDELWGGTGYDTFCFGKGYGKDIIKDFSRKQDSLFIDKGVAKNFKKLKKAAEKYKGGVLLDFKGPDDLFIEGLKKKQLKKIDIDFFHFDM